MSRTFILNLLFIINYMCRSALRFHTPSRCVTHPNDGYKYKQSWRAFHKKTQHTSSSLIWFSTSSLEDEFSPHVWRRRRTNFCTAELKDELLQLGFCRRFDQRWLWSTHGPIGLKFGEKFDFGRPYCLAQKSRSKCWPICCCVDF